MSKYTLILFLLCFLGVSAQAQIGECKGKYFGNITAYSVPSNYTQLWNQTTSENGSKWGTCDRGNGRYDFSNSDLAYNTAKNSGGAFKFHALIWGAQAPGYLENASPEQIVTAIRNWYQAVDDHYTPMGGLEMIDVLNEPVNTPIDREINNLKAALTMGYRSEPANAGDLNNPYGWAIWPFQLARQHFPDAVLLINEFNVEHNWNNCREEYINMSNAIKNAPNLTTGEKNLIDGIGLQSHGIENLSATAWRNCIDEVYNRTGLPIHISEFDIAADPNEAHQKTKYEEFISIAWEHPHVAGITLWGYIQGQTWRPGNGQTGPGGTDTGIMYENGQDRPAMTWLRSYMASQPSLPCCPAPAPFADCSNAGLPVVSITAPVNNEAFVTPASISITATATDDNGSITNVEFFNGNDLLGSDNSSPYAFDWENVPEGTYTIRAVATDNEGNESEDEVTVHVNVPQGPYNGNLHPVPGTIQLEEFDVGGNGFAYSDDSPGSETGVSFRNNEDVDIEECTDAGGGYNIGWATSGEWLEYSVDVEAAGTYDLELRVACDGDNRTISFEMDGEVIAGDVAVPNTGGWQTWQTITVNDVVLDAGEQIMRVTIGAEDFVNMNYVTFTAVDVTFPPVVTLTSPSESSGFTILETIELTAAATDSDGSVSSVSFYSGNTLLGTDNTEPFSFDWSGMEAGSHTLTAVATDDKGATGTSTPVVITVEAAQGPLGGTASQVPGRIEAEDYDRGGEGLAFHEANTNGNEGGATYRNDEVDIEETQDVDGDYNIGYVMNGEWLEYTVNVPSAGTFDLDLRVAADGDGKVMHVEVDGEDVTGPVDVPNTGGWQVWQTITVNDINLTEGEHVIRVAFDSDYMNLNYFEFKGVITGATGTGVLNARIFPNPFKSNGLQILQKGNFNYQITDVSGTLVESGSGNNREFVGNNLKAGIYFLTIKNTSGVQVQKIIKE